MALFIGLAVLAFLPGFGCEARAMGDVLDVAANQTVRNRVSVAPFGRDDDGNAVGSSQVGFGPEKLLLQYRGDPDRAQKITIGVACLGDVVSTPLASSARPVAVVEFGTAPDDVRSLAFDVPVYKYTYGEGSAIERSQDFQLVTLPCSFLRVFVRNDSAAPMHWIAGPPAQMATPGGAVQIAGWAAYGEHARGAYDAPRRSIIIANAANTIAAAGTASVNAPPHARTVRTWWRSLGGTVRVGVSFRFIGSATNIDVIEVGHGEEIALPSQCRTVVFSHIGTGTMTDGCADFGLAV